jgi:hypothetical protein
MVVLDIDSIYTWHQPVISFRGCYMAQLTVSLFAAHGCIFKSVTAPVEAEVTALAYLARTPRV